MKITMGHARALVSAGDEQTQVELFNRVVAEKLSVRDIERLIRGEELEASIEREEKSSKTAKISITPQEYTFKEHFGDRLSTKVEIKKTPNGKGKIIVNFNSDTDLNRIMDLLNGE